MGLLDSPWKVIFSPLRFHIRGLPEGLPSNLSQNMKLLLLGLLVPFCLGMKVTRNSVTRVVRSPMFNYLTGLQGMEAVNSLNLVSLPVVYLPIDLCKKLPLSTDYTNQAVFIDNTKTLGLSINEEQDLYLCVERFNPAAMVRLAGDLGTAG